MTEREMLELAAKAAGIEVWPGTGFQEDVLFRRPDKPDETGKVTGVEWNPRKGDADCFRLEDELEFIVLRDHRGIIVRCGGREAYEPYASHESKSAARRFASTRLAAEIGKNMP